MQKQICFVMAMLTFPAAMLAQSSAPPVKMGLWQTTNVVTVSGMQIPPEVAARLKAMGRPLPTGQPRTIVAQSCLTTEKWKRMFSDMQQNQNCHFTNQHQTSGGLSADMACKPSDSSHSSTGHLEVNFLSSEKMHGKVHVVTVTESQQRPIVMDMNFDGIYQGADCKGISPDTPKIVR